MKFIKKYWTRIISLILIIPLTIYVLSFAIYANKGNLIYLKNNTETKIYTIWHIETFEGGGKSRITYLNKISRSMEKKYDGILFMTKVINPDELTLYLNESTPDIISFGYGVGQEILPRLSSFQYTYDVRDDLLKSGIFNHSLYAIPYIMSGYALFSHGAGSIKFHCGQNDYINPNNVYNEMQYTCENKETQYEAYKSFVYNKDTLLLGTARDVYRVSNLNTLGRTNATITPISNYTDLIQYIGVTHHDEKIDEYISNLFSKTNQQSLVEYSLFSTLNNKIYTQGIYNDMEDAILKATKPNVFE